MANRAPNDGQHRSDGPAVNNGQRQRPEPDAHVGNLSGGENQINVPASSPSAEIVTSTHEE
jgi:hypothetical protein